MQTRNVVYLVAAGIALSASMSFAMTPAKDAHKQAGMVADQAKGVQGLKRQGQGSLGNENDAKALKALENPESKPASSDNTKPKK
ncbi:MAG: hypothetical protein HXY26_06085 [Hydrogenophilaceae bacterium]|nr:hypothetical protein [Hydrogenophilaceae bacterium]